MNDVSPADPGTASSLVRFFAIALGITAALQLPGVFAHEGLLPGSVDAYMPLVLLGIFGPTVAAYLGLRRENPKTKIRDLFASPSPERPSAAWLLLALVLPGLLLSVPLVIHRLAGGSLALWYPPDPPGRLVAGLIIATAEEIGWRGYALPRLMRTSGAVRGSVILGVLWAVWHIPMFLGQGVPLSLFPISLVYFVTGSIVFTWMYVRTKGSLLVAILLHLGAHLNNSHAAVGESSVPIYLHSGAFTLLAVLLLILDRATFSQGIVHEDS